VNKPTVFFSHSSKDSDAILSIKSRLDGITGGVLEIFQSSDGQSIPFGRNWVHKIEDGLKQATIMFVFVTPNSITSNWIYFEAGFAYSKDIDVIPVGLGVDIALLKAPLNLLQGFNITSNDGLNNIVSIINRKYDYRFAESFTDEDFDIISSKQDGSFSEIDLKDIFMSMGCTIHAEYNDGQGGKKVHYLEKFFE